MKKLILIFFLFFLTNTAYSQLKHITKKELKTLIKKGIVIKKEEYKESWIICNKDSLYFKSDTLILNGYIYNTNHLKDCCMYIDWTFTNKRKMMQSSTNACNPPVIVGKILTEEDFYRIKLSQKNNKLLLKRYNRGNLIDTYEVLGYSESPYGNNEKCRMLTLVRQ